MEVVEFQAVVGVQGHHPQPLKLIKSDLQLLCVLVLVQIDVPSQVLVHHLLQCLQVLPFLRQTLNRPVESPVVFVEVVHEIQTDLFQEYLIVVSMCLLSHIRLLVIAVSIFIRFPQPEEQPNILFDLFVDVDL